MTVVQLKDVMKFHLKNFNDEGVIISADTIHNEVLSDSDGHGNANSKNIYKAVIRWTLKKQNHKDKPWPSNWIEMSVTVLAPLLL
jgi:hypothetical protein